MWGSRSSSTLSTSFVRRTGPMRACANQPLKLTLSYFQTRMRAGAVTDIHCDTVCLARLLCADTNNAVAAVVEYAGVRVPGIRCGARLHHDALARVRSGTRWCRAAGLTYRQPACLASTPLAPTVSQTLILYRRQFRPSRSTWQCVISHMVTVQSPNPLAPASRSFGREQR